MEKLAVLLGGLLVVVLVGGRSCSMTKLERRAYDYQGALQTKALAVRPGMTSTPSEADVEAQAAALAREYELEVLEVKATRTDNTMPAGAGAIAADALGEIRGRDEVDAEGNVTEGAPLTLKSSVVEVRARVRGEGFLCTVERDVSAKANFGFALR